MRLKSICQRVATLVAWCCLVLLGVSRVTTADASDSEKINFAIPSQALQAALNEFALQSKRKRSGKRTLSYYLDS